MVFQRCRLVTFFALFSWGASGCASSNPTDPMAAVPAESTACLAGQAQIVVRDGSLQNLCGCAESNGQVISTHEGTLTCTVPVGTVVFFHYIGIQLQHQIISTGAPSFGSSAPAGPGIVRPVVVHTVEFDTAGSYSFLDAFDNGLNGNIVVQ